MAGRLKCRCGRRKRECKSPARPTPQPEKMEDGQGCKWLCVHDVERDSWKTCAGRQNFSRWKCEVSVRNCLRRAGVSKIPGAVQWQPSGTIVLSTLVAPWLQRLDGPRFATRTVSHRRLACTETTRSVQILHQGINSMAPSMASSGKSRAQAIAGCGIGGSAALMASAVLNVHSPCQHTPK